MISRPSFLLTSPICPFSPPFLARTFFPLYLRAVYCVLPFLNMLTSSVFEFLALSASLLFSFLLFLPYRVQGFFFFLFSLLCFLDQGLFVDDPPHIRGCEAQCSLFLPIPYPPRLFPPRDLDAVRLCRFVALSQDSFLTVYSSFFADLSFPLFFFPFLLFERCPLSFSGSVLSPIY